MTFFVMYYVSYYDIMCVQNFKYDELGNYISKLYR